MGGVLYWFSYRQELAQSASKACIGTGHCWVLWCCSNSIYNKVEGQSIAQLLDASISEKFLCDRPSHRETKSEGKDGALCSSYEMFVAALRPSVNPSRDFLDAYMHPENPTEN
jgi:hypothetical protein